MLQILQRICAAHGFPWSPKAFQTDFEQAVISAIKDIFPNVPVLGCYFHFTQAIWRNAKKAGLEALYNNRDFYVYGMIRKVSAMPLLKKTDIEEAYLRINAFVLCYDSKCWDRGRED